MLINHPADGATRGLTLRVCILGQKTKTKNYIQKNIYYFLIIIICFLAKKFVKRTVR